MKSDAVLDPSFFSALDAIPQLSHEEMFDMVFNLFGLPIEPKQHTPTPTPRREGTMVRRRTAEQVEQLERQIYEVLALDRPQSVRHVFYRLTDPRLPEPVDKTEAGYRQVQQRLSVMRRAGRIPYGWITDATRAGYHVDTFNSPGEFLQRVAGLYRGNLWAESDHYCEVWTESRSLAGVVQGLCRELAVSLYPAGGFASLTLTYNAAQYIESAASGKDSAVVFYVGDYDPAGVLIDRSIESELRKHLPPGFPLEFNRIAVNADQVAEYDLPTKPRKAGEVRRQDITETVEAEAMPAATLRELLRTSVEGLLPDRALEVTKLVEQEERRGITRMAELVDDRGLDASLSAITAFD